MKIIRRKTKEIKIGNVKIGANNPIAIQSMIKVNTRNVSSVIKQVRQLEKSGCEIIRIAVKDGAEAKALCDIKRKINIPLVADIHFDYKLALLAIKNGADKIRLNPGNIYKKDEVRRIVTAARYAKIPIRVGVNSGSIKRNESRCGAGEPKAENAMVQAAIEYIKMLEGFGFYDIVVSLKASSILETIGAYREFSLRSNYPLHLGVTATGPIQMGMIKSSMGIGTLLLEGIGDTFRVSLTAEPLEEVKVAKFILESLGLRRFGPEIISCPTCGRCEVDLIKIVKSLEQELSTVNCKFSSENLQPLKVAVMGCVVNGPGEAKEADLGIAFGKGCGLLFKKGLPVRKVKENRAVGVILKKLKACN